MTISIMVNLDFLFFSVTHMQHKVPLMNVLKFHPYCLVCDGFGERGEVYNL